MSMFVRRLGALVLGCAACGGETPPPENELPLAPQALVNPRPAVFSLIPEGESAAIDVVLLNGGQEDLVFSSITLADDDGPAFSIGDINPQDNTAVSQSVVAVRLNFAPPTRGVFDAELLLESNAENEPSMIVPIYGAAGDSPLSEAPDVVPFETTARVLPELGLAFVRFFNVGQRSAALADYALDSADGAFTLASGTAHPSAASPIPLARGAFVVITLVYEGTGTHAATFTLSHYDYAAVTYDESGDRIVPPLTTTVIDVTSDP